ncbi:MAG: hypothetical protein B2I17_04570 [Thermoplasmatales archaeon B_DKE]|nr:MAG: hypothetical protein B2I17_04570 [Thermoplasmatales archaeon B_DKE]
MDASYFMRIHRIPGIKKVVITTNLDDYSGDNPSSPLKIDEQPTGIRFLADGTPVLHYSFPLCPRCISSLLQVRRWTVVSRVSEIQFFFYLRMLLRVKAYLSPGIQPFIQGTWQHLVRGKDDPLYIPVDYISYQ